MSEPSTEDIYARLEAALAEQNERAVAGHGQIAELADQVKKSLEALIERATTERVSTISLGEDTAAKLKQARESSHGSGKALEDTQQQIAQLEKRFAERNDELNVVKELMRSVETEMTHKTADAKTAQEKITELETSLAEMETAQASLNEARAKMESAEQSLKEQTHALDAAREQAESVAKERADDQASLQAARDRVATLESAGAEKDAALDVARQAQADLERKLDAYGSDTQSAQARLEELQGTIAERDGALAEANESIKKLEQKHKKLLDADDKLRSRARDTAESERRLAASLEQAEAELKTLRPVTEESRNLQEKLQQNKQLMKTEQERADKLHDELESERAGGTKSAIAEQLVQALRENEEAKLEISKLRGTIESLNPDDTPKAQTAQKRLRIDDGKKLMGDILVEAGVITESELEEALHEQQIDPTKLLGSVLVEKRFASEDVVAQALAFQRNVEFIRIKDGTIQDEAIQLIDGRLAHLHRCIPIRVSGDRVVLAMTNPLDLVAIEDVERESGRVVEPVAATASEVLASIKQYYAVE